MNEAPAKRLSKPEQMARLRLALSEHVGPITFRHMLAQFGSGRAALEALPDLAKRGGLRKTIRIYPQDKAEEAIAKIEELGGFLLFWGDQIYPEPLAALEDAPPYLTARGNPHLLGKNALGIVGARNASANGRRFSFELARKLGESGLVIVSGLARGIDGNAHMGALETGTIAVLGGGLDVYYPRENRELQDQIAGTGLLLSEYLPGARPQAQNFPRRNRIISGLSLGVVVVEAAIHSGSLITARLALEQGREVFAVPGHPMDPRAKGPNSLLRGSALLIEGADDILEALDTRLRTPLSDPTKEMFEELPKSPAELDDLDQARKAVREMLGPAPSAIDDLVRQSGLSAAAVLTALLELELAGLARRHPGNKVSLN